MVPDWFEKSFMANVRALSSKVMMLVSFHSGSYVALASHTLVKKQTINKATYANSITAATKKFSMTNYS